MSCGSVWMGERSSPIRCLTEHYAADGGICTGDEQGNLVIWCTSRRAPIRTMTGHTGAVLCLEVDDAGRMVSGGQDAKIMVWDFGCFGTRAHTMSEHTGAVTGFCLLEDGRLLSASLDGCFKLWNLQTGSCSLTVSCQTPGIAYLAEVVDGFCTVSSSDTLRVWSTEEETPRVVDETKLQLDTQDTINCLCELRDDHKLACGNGRNIAIFDLDTQSWSAVLRGHSARVVAVLELQDRRLVSSAYDCRVMVWQVELAQCLKLLEVGRPGLCLLELQDGNVVTGSEDGALRVLDLGTPDDGAVQEAMAAAAMVDEALQEASRSAQAVNPGLFLGWQMPQMNPVIGQDHSTSPEDTQLNPQVLQEDSTRFDAQLAQAIQNSTAERQTNEIDPGSLSQPSPAPHFQAQMAPSSAAPVPHPTAPSLQRRRRPRVNPGPPVEQSSVQNTSLHTPTLAPTASAEAPTLPTPEDLEIPDQFLCAITGELMKQPVATADGHVYEQAAIERWLSTHNTAPMTGLLLPHKGLMPIFALQSLISDFRQQHRLGD